MSDLLYGKDDREGVVGLHPESYGSEMRLFYADGSEEMEEFWPYFFCTSQALSVAQEGFDLEFNKNLRGSLHYGQLAVFKDMEQMRNAVNYVQDNVESEDPLNVEFSPTQQFLTQTGITTNVGLSMGDLTRMQVDIETYSIDGFPDPTRESDEIIIISMSDNSGWKRLLHTADVDVEYGMACANEKGMLQQFVKTIHRRDPDTIEGHNLLGFDLIYLRKRCRLRNVPFRIGRDKSAPRWWESNKEFAEREVEYENYVIAGRSVIDSYFLANDYDTYARDLPSYGLKEIAKHFGITASNREYVPGEKIPEVWDENPKRLLKYALDDAIETREVVEALGNASFALTKIVPMTWQEAIIAGTASTLESIMKREYLHKRHSIPNGSESESFGGGYTEIFERGVWSDLAYADVSSLYPSIMLNWDVTPSTDHLGVFKPMLQKLTDLRLRNKQKLKELESGTQEYERVDAEQAAQKILINSSYGLLGAPFLLWSDLESAAFVTYKGREILKEMIIQLENEGARVVGADSVTADTPVYIKRNGEFDICSISELHKNIEIENVEVLTFSGWKEPNYTYEHETDKEIIQTRTYERTIKTTKDHSLFQDGEEVKPTELEKGDAVDTFDVELPEEKSPESNDFEKGFFWGAMCGDGSCSKTKRSDHGYSINTSFHNSDDELIQKVTNFGRKHLGLEFNVYDTMESSNANRATICGKGARYDFVHSKIYDKATGEKKVPQSVLNGSMEMRLGFLDGYFATDGHKYKHGSYQFDTKSHVLAAGVQLLLKKYHDWVSASTRSDKKNIISLSTIKNPRTNPNEVVRQRERGEAEGAVYDISTPDQTFIAGVGGFVAHNTDGALFVIPEGKTADEVIKPVDEAMPEGIQIDKDYETPKALTYKAKNYAKVEVESQRDSTTSDPLEEGEIEISGASLMGRQKEPFLREYIHDQLENIMNEDAKAVRERHSKAKRDLVEGNLSAEQLCRTQRLKKTMRGYKKGLEENENKHPLAQYEVALRKWDITGIEPKKGDTVQYYVRFEPKTQGTKVSRDARLLREYKGDEDTEYYLDRLDTTADLFRPFFEVPEIVFSVDIHEQGSLFGGPDLEEVDIKRTQVNDTPTESDL